MLSIKYNIQIETKNKVKPKIEMDWHFVNGIRGAVNNHKTNLIYKSKCKDGDKICKGLVSQEQLLDMVSVKTIRIGFHVQQKSKFNQVCEAN